MIRGGAGLKIRQFSLDEAVFWNQDGNFPEDCLIFLGRLEYIRISGAKGLEKEYSASPPAK